MTININELRRLAQAATPGPWFVWEGGVYAGRPKVKKPGELRGYDAKICEIDDMDGTVRSRKANARLIAAANPAAIIELLDRLEAAESVLKGFGTTAQEVECWLERYRCLERETEALRAKIAEMEKQNPVGWLLDGDFYEVRQMSLYKDNEPLPGQTALYVLPGAKGE